jgi:hypothetical protein
VLSNDSSNDKDDNNPLFNAGDEAKNDFKNHAYNKKENNSNTIFFGCMYIYISPIYLI